MEGGEEREGGEGGEHQYIPSTFRGNMFLLFMRLLECIASLLSQTLPPSQFTVPPRPPHVQPAWEKLPTLTPLQSNSFTQRQLETYFQVQHHLHCPPLSHSHHSIHPHPLSPHPHISSHPPSHTLTSSSHISSYSPLTYPHIYPPLTSLTPSPHTLTHRYIKRWTRYNWTRRRALWLHHPHPLLGHQT